MGQNSIADMFNTDPPGSHLYTHLLREAAYGDRAVLTSGGVVHLHKGQLVFGIHAWVVKTGLTEKVIRGRLAALEKVGEVVKQNFSKYSVISITSLMEGQGNVKQTSSKQPAYVHITNTEQPIQKEEVSKDSCRVAALPDPRVSQVIGLLNEMTGSKYKASAKGHAQNINGRLRDGHSVDDLMLVVKHKTTEWGADPRMAGYLRPETLFGNKFNGYLLAAKAPATTTSKPTSKHDLSNIRYESGYL